RLQTAGVPIGRRLFCVPAIAPARPVPHSQAMSAPATPTINTSLTPQPGHLYVVATPIGNLADLTERARAILGSVDLVACEDTRTTGGLLSRLGLRRDLVAYHEHNETH